MADGGVGVCVGEVVNSLVACGGCGEFVTSVRGVGLFVSTVFSDWVRGVGAGLPQLLTISTTRNDSILIERKCLSITCFELSG